MQQALVELAQIASGIGAPAFLFYLAEGLRKVGATTMRWAYSHSALAARRATGTALLLCRAPPAAGRDSPRHGRQCGREAEALFGQSLEIARRQEAKTFELRAATAWRALAAPGQARRRARPSLPRSTPGSPKVSHARPEEREGAARRACVRSPPTSAVNPSNFGHRRL